MIEGYCREQLRDSHLPGGLLIPTLLTNEEILFFIIILHMRDAEFFDEILKKKILTLIIFNYDILRISRLRSFLENPYEYLTYRDIPTYSLDELTPASYEVSDN